ncbi:MAG: pitrilysin family protein [Bacteroidota bacterium]
MSKKQPPAIHPVREISLPVVETHVLANGLPCYHINRGTQDVVRIEFVCWGGRPFELQPLVARATAAMLKEGSKNRSGKTIAEHFDYYGAGLSIPFQMDTGNLAMFSLVRQLPQVLPVFIELLCEPRFDATDLVAYQGRKQQSLREDLGKAEVVAYRQITECFYGPEHPYGYNSSDESFAALQPAWLKEHHQRCFHAGNGFVLISGRFDEATATYIHQQLAQIPSREAVKPGEYIVPNQPAKTLRLPHTAGGQTAIRVGRRLFDRTHSDAEGMYLLTQLLGGYFGSRLMENIREDKGYTYNISAAYDTLRFDGTFQIDTEVSTAYVEPTLKEIQHELKRLREELIAEEELQMVRNYLMGSFLTMIDGPFNWAETVRTIKAENLSLEALQTLIHTVQTIKAPALQHLAQQYFQEADLWTVVVAP